MPWMMWYLVHGLWQGEGWENNTSCSETVVLQHIVALGQEEEQKEEEGKEEGKKKRTDTYGEFA